MRRWAVAAGVRELAGDHSVAPDIAMQIVTVGPVHHATADIGPMPAVHVGEPIGSMLVVVELPANPDDRAGLRRDRRRVAVALAILGRLEQVPLFQEERMLLDVRDADVAAFPGGGHHEIKRVGAGRNGALDGIGRRLS